MGKDVLLKSKPDFGQKAGDTFMLDSGYIGGNSFTIVKHLFRGVKREYGASAWKGKSIKRSGVIAGSAPVRGNSHSGGRGFRTATYAPGITSGAKDDPGGQ